MYMYVQLRATSTGIERVESNDSTGRGLQTIWQYGTFPSIPRLCFFSSFLCISKKRLRMRVSAPLFSDIHRVLCSSPVCHLRFQSARVPCHEAKHGLEQWCNYIKKKKTWNKVTWHCGNHIIKLALNLSLNSTNPNEANQSNANLLLSSCTSDQIFTMI